MELRHREQKRGVVVGTSVAFHPSWYCNSKKGEIMVALRTALVALFFAAGFHPLPAWAGDPTKPVTLFESQIVECAYIADGGSSFGGGNCPPSGTIAKAGADLSRGEVKVVLVNDLTSNFGSLAIQIKGATLGGVIQAGVVFNVYFGTSDGSFHFMGPLPPTDDEGETKGVSSQAFPPGSYAGLFYFTDSSQDTNQTLGTGDEVWYVSGFKVP
jgi:hypothetical protein